MRISRNKWTAWFAIMLVGSAMWVGPPSLFAQSRGNQAADKPAQHRASDRPMRRGQDRPRHGEQPPDVDRARGGRSRGPAPPRPPMIPPEQITDQDIDLTMDLLREMAPKQAQRLERLRDDNPRRVRIAVSRLLPRARHWDRERRENPRLFQQRVENARIERDIAHWRRQWRRADRADDTKKADHSREQLRLLFAQRFDNRQRIQQAELAQFEQRLDQLRRRIEKKERNRDQLIESQLEQLLHSQEAGLSDNSPNDRRP